MKQIKNAIALMACCGILSTNAKQVGNKGASPVQPSPAPISYPQPKPAPIINTNQLKPAPYSPQPQTGQTYEDIYDSLRKKMPQSQDISTLSNIKNEAEKQINFIRSTIAKPSIRNFQDLLQQIQNPAKEIFKKYPVNFNKTQQQINDASANNTDIFTKEEQEDMIAALYNTVKEILNQFPTLNSQEIYKVIGALHPEFKAFQAKLNAEQQKEINNFLQNAVDLAYKIIIKS